MVETKDERLMVLCFDVAKMPENVQFALLACGALFTAIGFAFLQEAAFAVPGFKFGGFMGLLTSWTFCGCAALERLIRGDMTRKGDIKDYLLLSVFTAGGIYFTNWSLNYINYPMRVMFKSSKLIPTMVVGVFITGRKYGWQVLLLTWTNNSVSAQNMLAIVTI
jgi:adenosine 3'-phospho 5'-phosphosulfate transporter B3